MTHRFPIKEIALQAGMGTATIDRVLNNRSHVSPQTQGRVTAAIKELERQEAQLSARGRRMFFDVVIEAPIRFSQEVQRAAEAVLPEISSAVIRPRFLMGEVIPDADFLATIARILKRGSHGVCLKVRDTPLVREAIDKLAAAGIPVVTLFTDIPNSPRLAYMGLDNAKAGRTAAYLVARTSGKRTGTVLTTQSHDRFLGEGERADAFASAMSIRCPDIEIVTTSGGSGLAYETAREVSLTLKGVTDLVAIYSMGGGNQAILKELAHNGHAPAVFIAHDLDQENRRLLSSESIDFVLHHDLRTDLRHAFHRLLNAHGLLQATTSSASAEVQIITPENMPKV